MKKRFKKAARKVLDFFKCEWAPALTIEFSSYKRGGVVPSETRPAWTIPPAPDRANGFLTGREIEKIGDVETLLNHLMVVEKRMAQLHSKDLATHEDLTRYCARLNAKIGEIARDKRL